MKRVVLILALFLASCADKNEVQKDVDLKTQTLMFAQKHKISIDELNIVATLSYLNPTLDEESERDIFILSFTPYLLEFHSLKVFINHREAQVEALKTNDELLKYLINNSYTKYFKVYLPSFKKENFLKVRVCSLEFACFELDFQRYPKSLYYRSEDVDTQYN
ncbi:hypothetical protein Q2X75_000858 [Campylobacter upsaliensis]|nr:hypothetical protein [Campylobacter upsaliensis]